MTPLDLTSPDKFDIFVQLLFILLGIAALLLATLALVTGLAIYIIRRQAVEAAEKHVSDRFSQLKGELLLSMGLAYWIAREPDLNSAITFTTLALREKLDDRVKVWAENNLAYYYAELHQRTPHPDPDLKEKALELAEHVYKCYDRWREGYQKPTWIETYVFVTSRFAGTREELQRLAERLSHDLLPRTTNNGDLVPIHDDLIEHQAYITTRLAKLGPTGNA